MNDINGTPVRRCQVSGLTDYRFADLPGYRVIG